MSKHFNQCKGHVKCCEILMWKFGITHGFACTTVGLYNINNTFFYLFVVIQSEQPTKKCWTRFVNVCVIESDKVLFPLWKDQTPRLIKDRKTKNHYPHNLLALELIWSCWLVNVVCWSVWLVDCNMLSNFWLVDMWKRRELQSLQTLTFWVSY